MENGTVIQLPQKFSALAVEKIAAELKDFKGGNKEIAVSKFVASTLTHFCGENESFAEVVYKTPRTLSDCCAEVMRGCGNAISDIDVYRGAVKHYFPNADVLFKMEIHIAGDAPTEEEIQRKSERKLPEPKVQKPKEDKPAAAKLAPTPKTATVRKTVTAPIKTPPPESKVIALSLF